VRGSVSEQDADKVEVGQKLKVVFPNSQQTFDSKVEYINKAIESETRSARFRTSIPNPEGKFKAGMFVHVLLEPPPTTARRAVPSTSANKAPGSNIHDRLQNLKPKLDLLLRAEADRTATATFEAHLGALEQELELLVKEEAGR
jgi:multidrug efflux pump subunit AcrA (membrane-fusion protein)